MKAVKKILEIILNVIIILISIMIIIVIIYAIQTKVLKKNGATIFGYTAFEVATGSMAGTIEIGDVVIVKSTRDIKANDIIVYKENNNFITHRALEINEDKIITKGDANNTTDQPIDKEQVFGKVIKIIPNVAIWKKVLTTPSVLISVVITIVLFGIAICYNTSDNKQEKITKEK